jgi:hypothetical protein
MANDQTFEDKYFDVLQNIEFGIVRIYREQPDLTDWDALDAIQALIRSYTAEMRGRSRPKIGLSDPSQAVFNSVEAMCEWRLGREQPLAEGGQPPDVKMEPKTTDEIIACLKRVQKSINRWNKVGGRQGYLIFVSDFVQ